MRPAEAWDRMIPFAERYFGPRFAKYTDNSNSMDDFICIELHDASNETIKEYSFSEAGLIAANAAAGAGDLIKIGCGSIALTAAFTQKANTTIRGRGVYATFITATITGPDTTLITLGSDTIFEEINITYTSTASNLMVTAINSANNVIRNVHAYHYTTKGASAHCFHTGTNTSFKEITDCVFICDGNGGERTGAYASTASSPSYIRDVYAYGHCNTASVNAYGISVSVTISGAVIIMHDSYGYGYAQGGSIGWGIFTYGTVKSYGCYGYGRTGTAQANGFEVQSGARAYASCYGKALNDGGGTSSAWVNNASYMQDCDGQADSGTRYGVTTYGVAYANFCRFQGATKDIHLGAGSTFHVYSCQYDTVDGTGTLEKDAGDVRLGTGTDKRIVQWNGAAGDLEDSGLIGPTTGLLQIENSAAGDGAIVDFGLAEDVTLTINASIGTKTIDVIADGNVIVGEGGEVNKIPVFDAASHLVELDNAAGLLQNDGLGNLGSIAWNPLLNSSLPDPWALMASSEITIDAGVLVVDQSYHTVRAQLYDTEDDLVTINGATDRQFLLLMAKATHTITVKHNTGNIFLNGLTDFVLTGTKKLLLFYDEVNTKWSDTGAGGGGGGAVATDAIWDAKGDLAGGTGADTAARLPVGIDGQVLTANAAEATGLKWAAAGSGDMANDALWDAKGDIAIGAANNSGDVLAVGANGKRLVADSGETLGVKWDYDALYVGQTGFLVNEIMNFPSLEKANDTQPEWWSCAGTLTEVDVAGEGITETFERALKYVATDPGQYALQTYTYADQHRIKAGRKLSAIVAVWCVGGAEASISLVSSVGELGVSDTTTAAAWTILKVEGVTLDGTYVYLKLDITTTGTVYFVPLGVNVGDKALALPPRGLRFQWIDSVLTLNLTGAADPAAWTDEDLTADTSNLATMAQCHFRFRETEASTNYIFDVRRNGSSKSVATDSAIAVVLGGSDKESRVSFPVILDDTQVFEYILDRIGGADTLDVGSLYVDGYWEWE